MKINKTVVEKIELPINGQQIYWDSELKGFGIRATSGGSKAYVVQSRVRGKTIRRTIGEHGVYTSEQARFEAKKLLLQMEQGLDPRVAAG
jgi:predicted nucleotidyltransferase